ncbi:MAG TPA: helix-turn-helix domain-containing protein [Vicinamibacteria bacterium]|nr:helix-turn-helix domain-containing protein [Vicinamibacteria bacterium]
MTLKQRMNDYERGLILAALQATCGNQRRAAALLGILPSTLSEKLKRLGLRRGTADDTAGEPAFAADLPA